MLQSFPTVQEFDDNDFQRGYVHALHLAMDIVSRKFSGKAQYFENDTVEAFKDDCIGPMADAIHRYEPGHDKPANGF